MQKSNNPYPKKINKSETIDYDNFKKIFYQYYMDIYKFLVFKTRDYDISKDLTQEIFLKIWENRANLDFNRPLKPYLLKSANNIAIDHLRKKTIKQKIFNDNIDFNKITSSTEKTEIQEFILKALENLSEKDRLIFMLSRIEELKYKEIAEVMNLSIKTVEKRMSKTLKFLRELVKKYF